MTIVGPPAAAPAPDIEPRRVAGGDRGHDASRARGLSWARTRSRRSSTRWVSGSAGRCWSTTSSCARSRTRPSSVNSTRCAPRGRGPGPRAHVGRRSRRGAADRGRHPARSPPARAAAPQRPPRRHADAAAALDQERYLPHRPVVVCVGAVEELRARTPAKHALVGEHAAIVAPQHTDALTGPVGLGDAITDLPDARAIEARL